MSQIFHPSMNSFAKASIFGSVFIIAAASWVGVSVQRSPWLTDAGVPKQQPVPFSHEHHVNGLGIDCRVCHTSVEDSSFAGMPPTKTCMACHSKVWTDVPMLQPVRQSWDTGQPIEWTRVHNLPGFVYFDHSMHVNKGVGCTTCHGQVEQMPLMYQNASLQMEWCLNCHRDPAKYVRPRADVFRAEPDYPTENDTAALLDQGRQLVAEYHVPTDGRLTNCVTCHR